MSKLRIEIKVVNRTGRIEYRHVEGDMCPDGTPTKGPTDRDFAIVTKAILDLTGVPIPKSIAKALAKPKQLAKPRSRKR